MGSHPGRSAGHATVATSAAETTHYARACLAHGRCTENDQGGRAADVATDPDVQVQVVCSDGAVELEQLWVCAAQDIAADAVRKDAHLHREWQDQARQRRGPELQRGKDQQQASVVFTHQ